MAMFPDPGYRLSLFMRACPLIICLLVIPVSHAVAAETSSDVLSPGDLPPYSTRYDPQRDPYADGHAAIALAQKTGRRILIELGGDWCRWCHVMDDFFARNPDVLARLHQTFVILKINVSDANDNAKFLASFPRPLGYPHMYIAEPDGKLVKSKDTAEFLENGRYSRQRFMAFFKKWTLKPEQFTADTQHE